MRLGSARICLLSLTLSVVMSPGFALADSAKEVVLYSFLGQGNGGTNGQDGSSPAGALVMDAAGNLYGTTSSGGSSTNCTNGCGTVFQLIPPLFKGLPWSENILYNFQAGTDGSMPLANLTFDSIGNLYGTTAYGGTGGCEINGRTGCGTVFEMPINSDGSYSTEMVLHSFQGTPADGATPSAGLIVDTAGNLYGTTTYGGTKPACGADGCGVVFELSPSQDGWIESILYSFSHYLDGAYPVAPVVFAPDGNLYGTTKNGGGGHPGCAGGCGTIFQLWSNPEGEWKERVLHRFLGSRQQHRDGSFPEAGLVVYGNALYGTTSDGGNKPDFAGTVYELSATREGPEVKILYTASCGIPGPVTIDDAGNIYAMEGGAYGGQACETLFQLHPPKPGNAWVYNQLTQLDDGGASPGGLLLVNDTFYGASYGGGISVGNCQYGGCGLVFSIIPH